MTALLVVLVLCLAAACVRNRQLRRRIAALQAESARCAITERTRGARIRSTLGKNTNPARAKANQ